MSGLANGSIDPAIEQNCFFYLYVAYAILFLSEQNGMTNIGKADAKSDWLIDRWDESGNGERF